MKIVLLGAGSQFFESVFVELAQTTELHGSEIALYDIDADRMEVINQIGQRLSDHFQAGFRISSTLELPRVLDGAQIVIASIGVHGPATAWHRLDVEVAARSGVIQTTGDTVGPSGLSQALRIVPIFVDIAKAMEKYCPDGILLNHSNPMEVICRAVNKYSKIKIIGYCHNVYAAMSTFAQILEVKKEDLDFIVGGVNHMVWLLSLRHNGKNVYPELKSRIKNEEAPQGLRFTKDLLDLFDLYLMGGDRHIIEFFPHARRPARPMEIEYGLKWRADMISEGLLSEELTRAASELKERANGSKPLIIPKQRSPEEMAEQIKALVFGPDKVHVLNISNEGAIENLPPWAVVEVKSSIGMHGARPIHVGELPVQAARWTLAQIYAHELTVDAAVEQSRQKALQALASDPMIRDFHEARRLFDALVNAHGSRLSAFKN